MMFLFWVTTEDHCEDWFIVAESYEEAARRHENYEGYDSGDAFAEEILGIPAVHCAEAGWPSEELLKALGANFISDGDARVVELSGRKFCEGLLEATIRTLDDDIFESLGQDRVNQTTKDNRRH